MNPDCGTEENGSIKSQSLELGNGVTMNVGFETTTKSAGRIQSIENTTAQTTQMCVAGYHDNENKERATKNGAKGNSESVYKK